MSERDVIRAAVIAAAASGALCALGYLHLDHLGRTTDAGVPEVWLGVIELVPSWLVAAGVYGVPFGLFCGILPTIIAVAVWPRLESRLGTTGAIGALSILVAVIGGIEVALGGGTVEDWRWAAAAGVVCGLTSAYVLRVVALSRPGKRA